jgi:hypothetical protein
MSTIVVYESIYGNTRAIALAVAEGLGEATACSVDEAPPNLQDADLLVVGAPTHMHGLSTSMSRRMAFEAGQEDGILGLEPHDAPGVRQWLHELPTREGALAAAFDTRLDRSPAMTGGAARGIARRLRRRGYKVLGSESFLVEDRPQTPPSVGNMAGELPKDDRRHLGNRHVGHG